jgi:hypothetical protein
MKHLEQLFLDLEPGQTLREVCPECGGGSTRELSLSITLDETGYMLWHCFRASCGFSGKRLAWGVVHGHGSTSKKAPRGFTGALELLPKEQHEWLWDKFSIAAKDNWRWAPEFERLYMPVMGPTGKHRGCILRDTTVKHEAKTLTFKEAVDEPWMHWNWGDCTGPVVLVEDMFSAAKVQQCGIESACLLGTHFGLDKVREVLTQNDSCIIALDKDAYCKAVKYAVDYSALLNIRVWHLEQDLKYETVIRILEAYDERKSDFTDLQRP